MSAFADHARHAIDVVFEHLGVAATYAPPEGGEAVPCTVIPDQADRELAGLSGRPLMQANVLRVRRSEIAVPVAGGVFVVDGTSFSVVGDPRSDDPLRLEWVCTVE
jgi:hypothetical protein